MSAKAAREAAAAEEEDCAVDETVVVGKTDELQAYAASSLSREPAAAAECVDGEDAERCSIDWTRGRASSEAVDDELASLHDQVSIHPH